jgi:hypothetical protein
MTKVNEGVQLGYISGIKSNLNMPVLGPGTCNE